MFQVKFVKDKSNRLVAHDALDDAKSIFYFERKNFQLVKN